MTEVFNLDVNNLSLVTMVDAMVRSKDNWLAALTYADTVMYAKEEKERQFERENVGLSDSNADNEDSD